MSIKLKLDAGWNDLLKAIERAGGKIEPVTLKCMQDSADIMQHELKAQMRKSNVEERLIDKMPANKIENEHGRITARVGYDKGVYDPNNPSDAYKVVFLNYGTPHRKKHGKVKARGFIQRAKKNAKRKITIQQENALKEILRGLQK